MMTYTVEELEDFVFNGDYVIYKNTKNFERLLENRTKALIRLLVNAWKIQLKDSEKVINKIFKGEKKPTIKQKNKLIKELDKNFVDFANPLKKRIEKDVDFIYKTTKKEFVSLHGTVEKRILRKQDANIIFVFGEPDQKIISGLTDQHLIASNAFYERNLSKEVVDIIEGTYKEGLNSKNTGNKLIDRLGKKLGIDKEAIDLTIVPEGYTGSVGDYFKGLADTTLNRARSFSSLQSLADVDIEEYVIAAIIDRRTSIICRQMNGRRFTVKQGLKHVDKVINSKDVDELKSNAEWKRDLSDFKITGPNQKLNDTKLNSKIASSGLALPSYHFRCRTFIEPL